VAPRIAGLVYDWDSWPGRIAAGSGEVDWWRWRMGDQIEAISVAMGVEFEDALRGITKAIEAFGTTTMKVMPAFLLFSWQITWADVFWADQPGRRALEIIEGGL
jgi:hypothetical protein